MSTSDIVALKAIQDAHNARKQELVAQFTRFRDGFFGRIEEWTHAAIAHGLAGVVAVTRHTPAPTVVELTCTLNAFQLVFIASACPRLFELPGETASMPIQQVLAVRILAYPEAGDVQLPYFDILVYEHIERIYHYQVRQFISDGGRASDLMRSGQLAPMHGQHVADAVISALYAFDSVWAYRPTLGMMRDKAGGSRHRFGLTL